MTRNVMLSTAGLEYWQVEDLKEAQAAILLEMQRRKRREAARASQQYQLRAAIERGAAATPAR